MPREVDVAYESPGCCVLTGTSDGPFIQLDRVRDDGMGTAYVAVSALLELAQWYGLPTRQALAGAEEDNERLVAEVERLQGVETAYKELLDAVGTTLRHGAVVRHGQIELRQPRSAKRTPDLHVLREAVRAGA